MMTTTTMMMMDPYPLDSLDSDGRYPFWLEQLATTMSEAARSLCKKAACQW